MKMPAGLLSVVVLASLLTACDQAPASAPNARAISAAAAPAPAGNRFDGRYTGVGTLTYSRGSACGPQTLNRSVTVVNGNATFIIDGNRGSSATGAIQADGTVTMTSTQEATSVSGRFQGNAFTGEMRATTCHRTLELRRGAARS